MIGLCLLVLAGCLALAVSLLIDEMAASRPGR
jgi:hypothetical protein